MIEENMTRLRQQMGYSMHMMADFLGTSFDDYAELEFQLREATEQEKKVLKKLFQKIG